jgi:hypothetical protein
LQDGEVVFFAIFFPIFLDRSSVEQMKKIDTAQSRTVKCANGKIATGKKSECLNECETKDTAS